MTAGENQPQAIVGNLVFVAIGLGDFMNESRSRIRGELFLVASLAPDTVDGLVLGGLDNPGAGDIGDAGSGPLVHGGRKSFLRALFGQIEVADEPNQRGYDAAPIGAID